MWYPYIQVPIDPKITAVVGANESGKSHLLSAIEKAINGYDYKNQAIGARDFCRYSERFLVTSDKNRLPDFGTKWSQLSREECERIKSVSDISKSSSFESFFLFRKNGNSLTIYLGEGEGKYSSHEVYPKKVDELRNILPGTRRLKSNIALPSSIPIKKVIQKLNPKASYTTYEVLPVEQRNKIIKLLEEFKLSATRKNKRLQSVSLAQDSEATKEEDSDLLNILLNPDGGLSESEKERQAEEINLTIDLLCKIAEVSESNLLDLANSMEANDVGYTQALIDKINRQLSANLNFPNYWVQDSKFRLLMSARDHDLQFTIVDRTGTKYSFDERSSGLKYFLSYYIQHRAYEPLGDAPEILLMDEPDAFLSSQAQQDLLKIFKEVASSEGGIPESQVIYVTHSPFLIDKNHAERIRVLDKGSDYEGTRVVKSVSKNHYEPLRSALGSFIAETVYISHCNLMVEGPADQVLLAGASTHLQRFDLASKRESLDLNEITIVPAGGASSIPYLTYLARGRDSEQPAVIVFLDSDEAGNQAKRELTNKNEQKKLRLKEDFVLQVKDLKNLGIQFPEKLKTPEVEDLIPVSISVLAAQQYAKEICNVEDRDIKDITEECVQQRVDNGETMFDAVNACVQDCSKSKPHLEKIGFARSVIEVVNDLRRNTNKEANKDALEKFESNFKILFRELDKRKSKAELERTREKASQKVKNLSDSFFNNHPNSANREDAVEFLEKMEDLLLSDDSFDAEQIKKGIEAIRKDYKLNINLRERVEKYEEFKRDVNRLKDIGKIESEEKQDENEISSKGNGLPTPATESSTAANAKGVKIETKSSQAEHS
ncbi:AAA family ATPase [Limnoraphis robusta CCNP1324]|uniref:AAA family ATPase n=1 Tax=Limnoraphis robusta TaxID=1118279 RepID=UPI002B1F2C3C|nr:AAA family ATPase [Limnoraphis robusta]MEA5547275.1 AAA family ATPase [Limnoraphis robusta CCNP1324]